MHKEYVKVTEIREKNGVLTPLYIHWEDGMKYEVDRILDIRPAASLKAGGAGIRYTVRIGERITYLFFEEDRWFVEAKG